MRNSQRASFRGPFRGLNERTSEEALGPEWLRSVNNVEIYGGSPRPRRGYDLYATGNQQQPAFPIFEQHSPIRLPYRTEDELLLAEVGTSITTIWRRGYIETASTGLDWLGVSRDVPNQFGAFTFSLNKFRKQFASAGGVTLISAPSDPVYAFSAEVSDASEATGTATAGSASTISLQQVVGTTSEDITYSFALHEVQIYGGTGAGQRRQITSYDHTGGATERRASVWPNWTTNPDATSQYRIYRYIFRLAGLATPTNTPSVGAIAGGAIPDGYTAEYVHTWYDSNTGLESNPSPVSSQAVTSAGFNQIRVTWTMPSNVYGYGAGGAKTDLFANKVRIYRRRTSGTPETQYRFVAETAINNDPSGGTGRYTDNILDDARGSTTSPIYHDVPPRSAFSAFHRGIQYFVTDPSVAKNLIYFSLPSDSITGEHGTEYVRGFFTLPDVSFSNITGIWSFGDELIVWQEDACWRIDTTPIPDTPFITRLKDAPGCRSYWCIAQSDATEERSPRLYYPDDRGCYEFDGVGVRKITNEIIDTWSGIETGTEGVDGFPSGGYQSFSAVFDPYYGRYLLFYRISGDTNYRRLLMYDQKNDAWTKHLLPSGVSVRSAGRAREHDADLLVHIGLGSGFVGWLSNPESEIYDDDGTAIDWALITGRFDMGEPISWKHVRDLVPIYRGLNTGTIVQSAYVDSNSSASNTSTTGAISDGAIEEYPIYVGAHGRQISLGLAGTVSSDMYLIGYGTTFENRRMRG